MVFCYGSLSRLKHNIYGIMTKNTFLSKIEDIEAIKEKIGIYGHEKLQKKPWAIWTVKDLTKKQ